jgi:hypothetical protein
MVGCGFDAHRAKSSEPDRSGSLKYRQAKAMLTGRTAVRLSKRSKVMYLEDSHKVTAAKTKRPSERSHTASGYGSKLQTSYMVQLDSRPVWRRVYCICYSNSGSVYVRVNGERLFVRDGDAVQTLAKVT